MTADEHDHDHPRARAHAHAHAPVAVAPLSRGGPATEDPGLITVAVVDDHPLARHGVAHILGAPPGSGTSTHASGTVSGDVCVSVSVGSLAELEEALAAGAAPDVIVMDLYLDADTPALDGVAALAATTRVMVMSASARPADVLGAIRAGACGYVTKHCSAELFVSAVETVAAGGFSLSAELADILQAELTRVGGGPADPGSPRLSAREEETLSYVARGFTHAQIATRLGVRKTTVDTYVERIRAKLQVGNKAELTRAALARMRRDSTGPAPL
ncbi:LuxR C-terminal-related transcriptional regulator [Streptomyces bluensis]|uniref:LuxR C-terminal-related transcriptional regulator n=1 Tax=Streptomyces bluensis TaxID=33897 RepID=A0ABW6UUK4_9ACTN